MSEQISLETQNLSDFSSYSVKLDNFEGPLDLLLYFIRKQEIDIYDIPIAKITQQYLEHIQMLEVLDLELAGEFILMAATLIRIKTKMLLPSLPEEESDPRAELVQALLEHEKYQNASQDLALMESEQSQYYPRLDFSYLEIPEPVVELKPFTLFDLLSTFKNILERQVPETFHAVDLPGVSLEDRIQRVLSCLEDRARVGFEELYQDVPLRIYIVVTLLAVLELTRRGWVGFEQDHQFGPIGLWRIRN